MTYNKKVIELKSPEFWAFFDFEYLNGGNPIEDWYADLSESGQYLFQNLFKSNRKVDNPINWVGFKRFLKGDQFKKERIWELEFHAESRQYRVLGKFAESRKQAILLVGCYHKSKVYTPPDALETAVKRSKLLKEGRARLHERKIQTDF